MKINTPNFWYRSEDKTPLIETVLSPLSWLYGLGYRLDHLGKKPQNATLPVICIGNLVAGGSGKTPAAIALMNLIKERGLAQNPFFLNRGYGKDENHLLAQHGPVVTNPDRIEGAQYAKTQGADLILMDDGLQNPSLRKDVSFVVIDGHMGLGNLKTMPAGPLRQPLKTGLTMGDAYIIIGTDRRGILDILPNDKPVFWARINPTKIPDKNKPYLAFAGIGYPQKFFRMLKKLELDMVGSIPFPDHYAYQTHDMLKLMRKAETLNATLMTTKKDFVRIPEEFKDKIETLPIELVFEDTDAVLSFIQSRVNQ